MAGEFKRMESAKNQDGTPKQTKWGAPIYLDKLPPKVITAVYLGERMEPDIVKAIRDAAKSRRIKTYKASLHSTLYSLKFDLI
jgi:hypothetical protein